MRSALSPAFRPAVRRPEALAHPPRRALPGAKGAVWLSCTAAKAFRREKVMLAIIRMFAALMVLGLAVAQARDDGRYANSPLKSWFESLHSKNGLQCCADADGMVLADVDWDTKDGHYRVRFDGEWIVVPDDRVITEANRTGRPMVWPQYVNGNPVIRCFMPGSMI